MKSSDAEYILRTAGRIGVVRTDRLGDMVLTLPLLAQLKQLFPSASIEVITREYVQPLLYQCPVVDQVHYCATDEIQSVLEEHSFDVLFFPRPRLKECWSAFKASVPLRIGSAYRWYSPLFQYRIKDHRKIAAFHEAEYNCRMLGSVLRREVEVHLVRPMVEESARQSVDALLKAELVPADKPLLIVHPGSGGSSRTWPAERYAEVAQRIQQHHSYHIIITGTEEEKDLCDVVKSACPAATLLCGRLRLNQMIALIDRCHTFLSGSTGVMHVATALEKNIVTLFPNTSAISARRWGPYTTRAEVLSPSPTAADPDDLRSISVQTVVEAIEKFNV